MRLSKGVKNRSEARLKLDANNIWRRVADETPPGGRVLENNDPRG